MEVKFLIINKTELNKVDYDFIIENNVENLRKSVNGESFIISWEGDDPSFIEELKNKKGPYTHYETRKILDSLEWTIINSVKFKN